MHAGTTSPTDTELGIDLDATIPCEVGRDGDAEWHIFGACPDCNISKHLLVCTGCRDTLLGTAPLRCGAYSGPGKKFFTRALQL